jgi:hypothetical protein
MLILSGIKTLNLEICLAGEGSNPRHVIMKHEYNENFGVESSSASLSSSSSPSLRLHINKLN